MKPLKIEFYDFENLIKTYQLDIKYCNHKADIITMLSKWKMFLAMM